jgi:hypothetical protein
MVEAWRQEKKVGGVIRESGGQGSCIVIGSRYGTSRFDGIREQR